MSNEGPKLGEGLTVGGQGVDHKQAGMRKMVKGAIAALVGAFLVWWGVTTFKAGYEEYTMLETIGATDTLTVSTDGPQVKVAPAKMRSGELRLVVTRATGTPDATREQIIKPVLMAKADLGLPVTMSDYVEFGSNQPGGYGKYKEVYGPFRNLIVNAGENYLVDAFQGTVEPENLRYHGIGTGSVAAAETDTGCGTELTTQYNPDNTRATGSLTEGASTNIFRTQGTITVDATVTVAEFCLMSQAATGGGTMWSRVLISPTVGLTSGDSLATTYDLTVE